MSGRICVVPEDLHLSAGKVDGHACEMHARHVDANSRIGAAQVGVPTNAALALTTAVTKWQADTTVLHGNLVDHSRALLGAATGYRTTEDNNAAKVHSVGDEASALDLGL